MAKQIGEIKIVGTFADITFYKMDGQYYARMKSSLTGKRVKRDPMFARTMASARRLAKGSQLASKVYRSLPRAEQEYTLYKKLKSLAVLALKEGASEAEVLHLLQALAFPPPGFLTRCGHSRNQRRVNTRPVPLLTGFCKVSIQKLPLYKQPQQRRPKHLRAVVPVRQAVDST
jgi:hypothetical protein